MPDGTGKVLEGAKIHPHLNLSRVTGLYDSSE